MGHAPFQYPTPDGYADEAGPWLGTLLWRWNFAAAFTRNHVPGTRVDVESLRRRAGSANGLAAHLLGRRPTPDESRLLASADDPVALALASPPFQKY
jgi:hypothetical protein